MTWLSPTRASSTPVSVAGRIRATTSTFQVVSVPTSSDVRAAMKAAHYKAIQAGERRE